MTTTIERFDEGSLAGTGYTARRLISRGASADVYEAENRRGELRAVKILKGLHGGTRDARRRFALEGSALAALDHPNLAPVLDAGVTRAGRPYFVMPRLLGETARDRLFRAGPWAPANACAAVADALQGLDFAHRAGLVHRDVKPANLFLVARTERCVVLDFGIAKALDARHDATTGVHVLGTPRYFAPEQVLGGAVDARTDVYAAGLTLFELITGRSPYDARDTVDGIDMMRAHVGATPRRARELVNVSEALERAIGRALEKAPARRWSSARAFAAELDRAASFEKGAVAR